MPFPTVIPCTPITQMKIDTIFFDLGKVLIDFDFNIALHRVKQHSSLKETEIEQRIKDLGDAIDRYETGIVSTEDFFSELKERLGYLGTVPELKRIWQEIFTPIDDHIQMARILSLYYPLGMISNTSEAHIDYCMARFEFMTIFQQRFYSYEIGVMKPDPEIYLHALNAMGADKYTTLFIDDREENILTPSRMGWQTIHLRPDVDLRIALQSYDLKGV